MQNENNNENNNESFEYDKLAENDEVSELNEVHEVDEIDELNEGIKKSKIRCLMCNSSELVILGEVQSYEVYSGENNYEFEEEENYINTIKLACKHCGLVLEYDTKYFTDKEKRKVVKKISREKNMSF